MNNSWEYDLLHIYPAGMFGDIHLNGNWDNVVEYVQDILGPDFIARAGVFKYIDDMWAEYLRIYYSMVTEPMLLNMCRTFLDQIS